jgi:hypothetical protein
VLIIQQHIWRGREERKREEKWMRQEYINQRTEEWGGGGWLG